MGENNWQFKPEGVSAWSKWIVGLSLFSATGCIGVFLSGIAKSNNPQNPSNIKYAISFFLLTIFIAWILQLFLSLEKKETSMNAEKGQQQIKTATFAVWTLVILEIASFGTSILFLLTWIWNAHPK